MNAISDKAARANLASMINRVCADHSPIIITKKSDPAVVMVSLEDYEIYRTTVSATG